ANAPPIRPNPIKPIMSDLQKAPGQFAPSLNLLRWQFQNRPTFPSTTPAWVQTTRVAFQKTAPTAGMISAFLPFKRRAVRWSSALPTTNFCNRQNFSQNLPLHSAARHFWSAPWKLSLQPGSVVSFPTHRQSGPRLQLISVDQPTESPQTTQPLCALYSF